MGLRIIDRHPPTAPIEVSESDFFAELTEESKLWAELHGFTSAEAQKKLLEKVSKAKSRLPTATEVTACANRIREQLAKNREQGSQVHAQVDIATLLELL